jgi:hypothetical protein
LDSQPNLQGWNELQRCSQKEVEIEEILALLIEDLQVMVRMRLEVIYLN